MITRWRIEAEADNLEDVEDEIEGTTQAVLGHLRDVQPEDQWECTDEVFKPHESIEERGRAVAYGRRVFRRMNEHS